MTAWATRHTRGAQFVDRAAWQLTRHFFSALFDFGILSAAGADSFTHMLLGAVGGVVSFGLLLTYVYAGKYAMLWGGSPDVYRRAVLGDDLLLAGLPMLFVAFVTLLVSHSLFPDERDFRILGPLPVRRSVVFAAKLTALVLFTGFFAAVAHASLLPLLLLTSFNPFGERAVLSRLTVWAITGAGASIFAVLAVTAVVGLAMLAASRSRFQELIGIVRSAMLVLLVLCVPFVLRLPTLTLREPPADLFASGLAWLRFVPAAWFVGLQQVLRGSEHPSFRSLAGIGVAAMTAAAAIVAMTYAVLFRHFERLVLRPAATSPVGSEPDAGVVRARPTRVTRAQSHPAFRAVHQFTVLTLRRSQLHQGVLVGLSACGAGFAITGLIDANLGAPSSTGEAASSALVSAAVWTPFALMFVCGVAVRAALALPMEYRANWIFRFSEVDEAARREQMRAVDRIATTYVAGVPVAASIPILWTVLGPTGLVAGVVVALVGVVFVHAVLLDWRRIPFTCSYLPGKRFIGYGVLLGLAAFWLVTLTGAALAHAAIGSVGQALAIAAALSVAATVLRRRRLAAWRNTPLAFEDEFPDQPLQLGL